MTRQERVVVGPAKRVPGARTAPRQRPQATAVDNGARSASWTDDLQREILRASCWLDPGDQGSARPTKILFTGRRAGATGRPQAGDRFSKEETLDRVVGGSGPVSVTTKVSGINPGEWIVTARVVGKAAPTLIEPLPSTSRDGADRTKALLWPWTYRSMSTAPRPHVRTTLIPFAPIPGVIPGAYSMFVLLGIVAGLAVQALVLAGSGMPVRAALTVSLWAVVAGVIGAKAWYVIGHRGKRFNGWCIQGFVLGAAGIAAILATTRLAMPVGSYLDSMAPGLFVGMAIGRIGCFFAGCCCGRPTRSRWGVWSSDQKVGARRIPTQLLESSLSAALAVSALILVLTWTPAMPGGIFVGALAAYTFGRQFVLPLRARPLYTRFGRPIAVGTAAIAMAAAIVWSVAG